jgi:hypothetical protein
MTDRLRLTVPLLPGQDLKSFLSHMTLRNGVERVSHFCSDYGLHLLMLNSGRPDQISRLATLSGVPESELLAEAIAFNKDGRLFRGQQLGMLGLRPGDQAVCPACLRADAASSQLPFPRSAYMRTVWRVAAIRTCPRHGMAIGEHLGTDAKLRYEPAAFLEAAAGRLDAALETATRREASSFERYLLDRLDGQGGVSPFLDRLEFYVAARFCELLGLVAREGPEAKPSSVGEDRLHAAAALGFEVAVQGEDAVATLLVELQSRWARLSSTNAGPGAPFGALYRMLASTGQKPAYASLRQLLTQHVKATVPIVPGRKFLGELIHSGAVQSVRTASLMTGAHPRTVRKLIAGMGLLNGGEANETDHGLTFDAARAEPMLSGLAEGMSINAAAAYLNIGRVAFRQLVKHGCLRPILSAGQIAGMGRHVFTVSQLDLFLEELGTAAVPVGKPPQGTAHIYEAARYCCCAVAEVIDLVRDGRLPWVGRHGSTLDFQALLVRIDDVRPLVRGAAAPGLTLREFTQEIGASDALIKLAIRTGAIKVVEGRNPINRRSQLYVPRDQLDAFRREYVASSELATISRRHPADVRTFLFGRGVIPRLSVAFAPGCFYVRFEVEPHAAALKVRI